MNSARPDSEASSAANLALPSVPRVAMHADASGAGQSHRRLEGRLHADDRQVGVLCAQQVYGGGGGRVAGDDQRLDAMCLHASCAVIARERAITWASSRSP